MKDFDKDFTSEDKIDAKNHENKTPINEVNNSAKSLEDVGKGLWSDEKEPYIESKNNEEKEETVDQKEPTDEEKGQNYGAEAQKSGTLSETEYSSCYKPPYYVPNFTVNDVAAEQSNSNKKRKKKRIITVVIIAAVIVTLALFVGVFATANFFSKIIRNSGLSLGDEDISIIQNAPQLNITQNTDANYEPKSLPEVVSKVGNSVVEITTSSTEYFGQYVTSGAGSGVIVTQSDDAGYLLTNHHVVYTDDAPADNITVVLTNGEQYSAQIVGSDNSLDLAVLRIQKKQSEQFTVAEFGDSSKLVVGQDIIAIGNPLGSLGGTVTDGIISALDRKVIIDNVEMQLLQHNAAINPGNSGGALFDMMGNLVGIVNAKSSDIGIEGLGFAIPANIALDFINRIMVIEPLVGIKVKYGQLRGVVGVYIIETSNDAFQLRDRIIAINGQDVKSAADYYAIIGALKTGDTATVTVRRNGVDRDIKITLKG